MPYGRLQYNWDNQYTTKDKRNLLLTQEVIEKINNIMPSPSQGGAEFVTQAEYDALPASKTSDGNLYIVVDNHNEIPVASLTIEAVMDEWRAGNEEDGYLIETGSTSSYVERWVDRPYLLLEDTSGVLDLSAISWDRQADTDADISNFSYEWNWVWGFDINICYTGFDNEIVLTATSTENPNISASFSFSSHCTENV